MVADKVPDDLLEIDRQVRGLFVDREMLIAGHFLLPVPARTAKAGGVPPAPPNAKLPNNSSNPITEPHQSPVRRARTTLRGGWF